MSVNEKKKALPTGFTELRVWKYHKNARKDLLSRGYLERLKVVAVKTFVLP